MAPLSYVVFILSGAAGLIYESIWARYLSLLVGNTAYAQVLVLAIFLGGMAVGAGAASRVSARLRDPLVWYAAAELSVGIVGLAFHSIFVGTSGALYGALFPTLGGGAVATAVKWTTAAALVLPQAVVLGATFPLMAAAVLRRAPERPGRVLGNLYFSNNIGAAAGVLVAGFVLLAWGGLPGTVRTAGLLNLIAGAAALGIARGFPVPAQAGSAGPSPTPSGTVTPPETTPHLTALLLSVSFGTAAASFAYEIGWLRMLSLVLGSATHSFEIMLSAFILGLALGSLWIRRRADTFANPLAALGVVQWVMGATAILTLALYARSFEWTAWMINAFTRSDAGYTAFSVGKYALSLAIMLPSTICAGMTLPLITRTLVVRGAGERAIGEVYSLNTMGAIVGVVLAALVLLPAIGMRGSLVTGAALDMGLGVWLLAAAPRRAVRRFGAAWVAGIATAAMVLAALASRGVEREVLAGGVFRYGTPRPPWLSRVQFYRDGRTATVAVYETENPARLVIATNGKADGSLEPSWLRPCPPPEQRTALRGDVSTFLLGPLITLAHVPDAQRVALVGHGTGLSAHFVLGNSNLQEVVTVEIEPEMVRGSRAFYPANARVFGDPRSRLVVEDARTFFASSGTAYDAIVSQPSNPWVSGVASLFTAEFYGHVRRQLTDGGVFGQWLHLYESTDDLVLSVLAAIRTQFPRFALYQTSDADLLIVAFKNDGPVEPDWSVFDRPAYAEGLCHVGRVRGADLRATRVADGDVLAPLLAGVRPNSDFRPVLDLGAERARYAGNLASGFLGMSTEVFNLPAALSRDRLGLPDSIRPAPANIARLVARARAAAVRAGRTAPPWPELGQALYYHENWRQGLGSREPPADWLAWLAHFRAVEGDRSSGLAGEPDDALYAAALAYVQRHHGPLILRRALALHQALVAWRFDRAAAIVDSLELDQRRQPWLRADLTLWIPATLLIEGGVVARLQQGDTAAARALLGALGQQYDRPPRDVRRQLLEAVLR